MNKIIKLKHKFSLVLIFLLLSFPLHAKEFQIYGGTGNKSFLGCIGCNEFSSDSICNRFGTYGNEFSTNGMFNKFAGFGNEFSRKSPWNEFSTSNDVPVLVDKQGNFYGYFTINQYRSNAVDFAGEMYKWFKRHNGNIEQVRRELCSFFGQSH